jgi:hypothetical protein
MSFLGTSGDFMGIQDPPTFAPFMVLSGHFHGIFKCHGIGGVILHMEGKIMKPEVVWLHSGSHFRSK